MKTLTILRHAKSSWKDPNLSDHDRPLNKRGECDAPAMASRIKDAGIRPSLILSSTAERAWTTAKTVAMEISYPKEFLQREADLYLAAVPTLLKVIASQDNGFNSIMLVGHNPGLTELANHFVPGVTSNIPTCGLISVNIESDDWDLQEPDGVELIVFDYPKKNT